jgi:hypothetical protein
MLTWHALDLKSMPPSSSAMPVCSYTPHLVTLHVLTDPFRSASVALAGMILPFGFGAALAVPLYHKFIDESVKFTHFMVRIRTH